MSFLIVMPQADVGGGAENMLLNFLLGAREVRPAWDWSIVFLRGGPFIEVLKTAGFLPSAVFDIRLRTPIACLDALRRIVRIAKDRKASALISWSAYGQLFGGAAALITRLPALWYQISFARGWMDRVATLIPARRILTVSNHVAQKQERLPPRRLMTTVWPGIDLDAFTSAARVDRGELRLELGLPLNSPIAVMVGRLQRWKGMHTAISAMPSVLKRFPDARLVLVGGRHGHEPDYQRHLEDLIERLCLRDSVRLAGLQGNVAEWMSAADVVIHASQEEPFGIVAVEAMACGRPVITGSDGGVGEAVRDGVEGIHAPFGDSERLAAALMRIFGDPDAAAAMGSLGVLRGKLFTRARYSEEICQAIEASLVN